MSAAPSLPRKFAEAFKVDHDIKRLVADFDLTKVNVKGTSTSEGGTLTYPLAPCLGDLNKASVESMDAELKISIAAATRAVANLSENNRTWEHLLATLQQCPVLECRAAGHTTRADRLVKEGYSVFSLPVKNDDSIVKEIQRWFVSLIQDEDILKATPINCEELANIVASAGTTETSLTNEKTSVWWSSDASFDKVIMDVGVLRYPDSPRRIFKAYHIKLNAWSYSTSTFGFKSTKYGISGQFNCNIFQPRSEIIAKLSTETVQRAKKEAEELFS